MASNPRGFNRGRYYGKNQWRSGFRARNNFRNHGRNRGSYRGRVNVPPRESNTSSLLNSYNGDESDDVSVTLDRSRSIISSRPITNKNTSPYAGWNYYFHNEEYKNSVPIVRKVKAVENFIDSHRNLFNIDEIEERRSCIFDLRILFADSEFLDKWPTFEADLVSNLSNTLNCLGLALYQTVWETVKEESCIAENDLVDVPMIRAHIINFDRIIQLKDIKSKCFGKTVSVHGTVIRVSNVRLRCSWLAFQCVGCETIQCVKLEDGIITQPTSCLDKNCRLRTFTPLRMSKYTQTIDWQTIKLQEMVPNEGRVAKTIECELLEDDLVNSCSPGDIVTIIGTVKIRSVEENAKKTNGPSMSTFYVEAAGLVNSTSMHVGDSNGGYTPTVQFVQKDYDAIHEIKSTPDLFRLLVHSLCPTIYGHEMVKAGLLLALFGGSQSDGIDNRGESHVLVVGDPGLGKSQMLQACSLIAPRGVFVCGNTTTSSGLTVTLTRDGGGDYSLEAGALVLADQGCCCIDEFDKMSSQHQSLLEAMELQTVSIAKAGVICQLPARTSVLAAANPVGGHYNKGKTVSENLRMDYRLLSRFDLVFILLDKPNKYLDALLSEHVLKTHSGLSKESGTVNVEEFNSFSQVGKDGESLSTKLKGRVDEELDLIPSQLLRKYIAYARKFIPKVTLSNDARKVLQKFYLQSRENYHTSDSTPVTTRQLRSLLRLTQARAKIELREEATLNDALDVIDIVKSSLIDTLPEDLNLNFSQGGAKMSKKNQAKRFLMVLHKRAKSLDRFLFDYSEMKDVAVQAQMDVSDFSSFIATLNDQGYLLRKGENKYQLQSVD